MPDLPVSLLHILHARIIPSQLAEAAGEYMQGVKDVQDRVRASERDEMMCLNYDDAV